MASSTTTTSGVLAARTKGRARGPAPRRVKNRRRAIPRPFSRLSPLVAAPAALGAVVLLLLLALLSDPPFSPAGRSAGAGARPGALVAAAAAASFVFVETRAAGGGAGRGAVRFPPSLVKRSALPPSLALYFSAAPPESDLGRHEDQDLGARRELEAARRRWRRPDLFGRSLVDETLARMEEEKAAASAAAAAAGASKRATAVAKREELARKRRSLDRVSVPSFASHVSRHGLPPLARRSPPTILQVNIGLYCNQACSHCHVESSPLRRDEAMDAETVARCLRLLGSTPSVATLDITGGAPELNENFRMLVALARARHPHLEIIDRCNLTVLLEPGQEDLVDFLRRHRVRVVASLPCYEPGNVDRQRGDGVFDRSVAALLALNEAGYGREVPPSSPSSGGEDERKEGSDSSPPTPLVLDLVYNPGGPFLPPDSKALEAQYKEELRSRHGIVFNRLIAITNMPIKRYADELRRAGRLQPYMDLLVSSFNPAAVGRAMCSDTVSVDYRGRLYDCDFNQQLGLGIGLGVAAAGAEGSRAKEKKKSSTAVDGAEGDGGAAGERFLTVFDVSNLDGDLSLPGPIRTGNHCYGCTAGAGSSCQGATAAEAAASTAEASAAAEELAP